MQQAENSPAVSVPAVGAASSSTSNNARNRRDVPTTTTTASKQTCTTRLHILSATYGPAEGRRLLDGKLVDYNEKETYVPYTRDVLPFLRALMNNNRDSEENDFYFNQEKGVDGGIDIGIDEHEHVFNINAEDLTCSESQRNQFKAMPPLPLPNTNAFPLMDGPPMNAVFGDPCPGTTKLLRVEYLFRDYYYSYDGREQLNNNIGENKVAKNDCDMPNLGDGSHGNSLSSNGDDDGGEVVDSNSNGAMLQGKPRRRQHSYQCTTSRIFQSTFREHERVLLKRQDPLFPVISVGDIKPSKIVEEKQYEMKLNTLESDSAPGMIPISSSSTTMPQSSSSSLLHIESQPKSSSYPSLPISSSTSTSPSKQWRLAPTTAEITLPIILLFLTVRQRAKCQLVCSSWRDIVLERGIAVVIDVNDVGLFPKDQMGFAPATSTHLRIPQYVTQTSLQRNNTSTNSLSSFSSISNHPSRTLLRGLLNHSYSSLESLVLNDFLPLQPTVDLHPALPFLRKLTRLDISRIPSITDETLQLISTCIGDSLHVLYMKGLRQVTNDGMVHLAQSCHNLRVLDVSQVHQLNDEAGIAIGHHLTKLEVLHCKDNYKMTNQSVDVITMCCKRLVQVTFWGCIKLNNVCFHKIKSAENDAMNEVTVDSSSQSTDNVASLPRPSSLTSLHATPTKLVLLNFWGCHNLTDAAADQMTNLPHLRSLCVSECHRLTDQFVSGITQSLPHLAHLQLRYLRRITDTSLESIAHRMLRLYSLDVSFCTKLTIRGLTHLLIERCTSLSELRLYACRQLNVERGSLSNGVRNGGSGRGVSGGRRLVQALKFVREVSILSFLDIKKCQDHEPVARDDQFLKGMRELGFDETLHGLFVRSALWNQEVRMQPFGPMV